MERTKPLVNFSRLRRVLLAAAILGVVAAAPLLILPGTLLYFDTTPKVVVVLLGTAAALLLARNAGASVAPGWFRALLAAQGGSNLVEAFGSPFIKTEPS